MQHGFRNLNLHSDVPRIRNLSSYRATDTKVLVENLVDVHFNSHDALAHVDWGIHCEWINFYIML